MEKYSEFNNSCRQTETVFIGKKNIKYAIFLLVFFITTMGITTTVLGDTFYTIADTYIGDYYPNENRGNEDFTYVGELYDSPTIYEDRSLFKWDLSSLTNVTVTSAVAKFYCHDYWGDPGSAITPEVYKVTSSWSENSVTWDTQPSYSGPDIGHEDLDHSAVDQWYVVDHSGLIPIVQGWIDSPSTNHGLIILIDDDYPYIREGVLRAREYSSGAYKAELIVTYSSTPPSMELELYRVSDTTGTQHTSNPGNAKSSFEQGDTVRVTMRARNNGPSNVGANWVLNLAPNSNHGDVRYNSDPSPNNTNDKTIPNDGSWYYYSFDWVTDSSDSVGSYDLLGAVRSASNWDDVLDDTEDGANTRTLGPSAWKLSQFQVVELPNPSNWPMYAKDVQNSSQSNTIFPNNITERWAPVTTGNGDWAAISPVIYEGKIFVNSVSGTLNCIDSTTGIVVWSYNPNQGITYPPHSSTPAVSNGIVVVGSASDRQAVVAIGIDTGSELWSYSLNVNPTMVDPVWASPTIVGNVVLIQNRGYIWALNLFGNGDGTTSAIWGGSVDLDRCERRIFTPYFYDLVPAVVENKVYAVTYCKDVDRTDTSVVCLDLSNGTELWHDDLLTQAPWGSPVAFPSRNEVIISLDETLYAYDMTGSKRVVTSGGWGTPAIFGNSIFCLKNTIFDVDLIAIDGDGSLLWKYDRRWAQILEDPICDKVGNVIFGSTDGFIVCIDSGGSGTDNDILWEKALEGDLAGKAAGGRDSIDFIAARSTGGKLYSLVTDTPDSPPTVQILTPNAGGYFRNTVTISASAIDDVGVSYVQFEYSTDHINWYILPVGSQDDPANDARDWNGADGWGFDFDTITADSAIGFAGNLNAAQVWVRARALDTSGNLSTWDECDQPFSVDNEGPDLSGSWARTDPPIPGTYEMLQSITDNLSGVRDDAIYPRFYYRWNNDTIDEINNDGTAVGSLDGSYYKAAITVGSEHIGDTIYWRVRALDNVGNENWSNVHNGGIIQVVTPSISVTPSSRDFGAVEVGSCGTNQTFTVENVGGGTLTGNTTVPSPFNIESGGSYSLTSGQTQVVVSRQEKWHSMRHDVSRGLQVFSCMQENT